MAKIFYIILLLLITGCTSNKYNHGYSFNDLGDKKEMAFQIKPGQQDELYILNTYGSPTILSNVEDRIFYYINNIIEEKAFFKPKLIEQNIVAISFDENHIVKKVEEYSINNAKNLKVENNIIVVNSKELSIIKQFMKNLGRFNSLSDKN